MKKKPLAAKKQVKRAGKERRRKVEPYEERLFYASVDGAKKTAVRVHKMLKRLEKKRKITKRDVQIADAIDWDFSRALRALEEVMG